MKALDQICVLFFCVLVVIFFRKEPQIKKQNHSCAAFNSTDPNRTGKKILLMVEAGECRVVIFKGLFIIIKFGIKNTNKGL